MGKNYGGAASGAVSGASTGATVGSVIPGVGTAVGGAVGAVVGGVAGLFKKKKKKKKLSTLDKDQQKLNKAQHGAMFGEGPLADLYNYDPEKANEVFDKNIGRKAYRDLNEKAIPSVTGQFRSNGLMQSSYAGDAIAKLARDVQESLDAQRTSYQFGLEQEAKGAKRNAVENLQNRNTQAYSSGGQGQSSGSSGEGGWTDLLTPDNIYNVINTFDKGI